MTFCTKVPEPVTYHNRAHYIVAYHYRMKYRVSACVQKPGNLGPDIRMDIYGQPSWVANVWKLWWGKGGAWQMLIFFDTLKFRCKDIAIVFRTSAKTWINRAFLESRLLIPNSTVSQRYFSEKKKILRSTKYISVYALHSKKLNRQKKNSLNSSAILCIESELFRRRERDHVISQ